MGKLIPKQFLSKLALSFGKSVADNGWGMFTSFLNYKLEEQGKKLIKIDKWFPSSKMCSHCGEVLDRDYNASINIKNEGMRIAFA